MMVGVEPSGFMPFGRTRKYGTLTPSDDVAQNCSTTSREASKRGGNVLTLVAVNAAASANHSEVGSREALRSDEQLTVVV